MGTDIDGNVWIEAVNTYFRKVHARDSTVLDLFSDDVQIFFPKFGLAHGKAALVRFSEIMTSQLESIEHDIETLAACSTSLAQFW
jgi:hypothetical protein